MGIWIRNMMNTNTCSLLIACWFVCSTGCGSRWWYYFSCRFVQFNAFCCRKDVEQRQVIERMSNIQVNWHCYHNLRYPSYHYCRIIPACCTKVCRILDRDGNCYWLIRSWITSSCCIYFIEFQGLYQSRSEVELIHECTVWLMISFSDRFPIFILARSYCCWCCYPCDWSCYCRQCQHQRYPCCQEGWRYHRWYRAGGWSCAQSERCQKCWWSNSSWKSQDWFDPVPIVATKAWCKCGMD